MGNAARIYFSESAATNSLFFPGALRHEEREPHPELPRGVGHGHAGVAAGAAHQAHLLPPLFPLTCGADLHLLAGAADAADLERPGRLQVLQLQED